jgi:hypothetical protein
VKTANGPVRTLVKLMGRVHQVTGINRLETPDAEAAADTELDACVHHCNFIPMLDGTLL